MKKNSTIISETVDKPLADKKRHYVNPKEFYQAIVERKKIVDAAKKEGKEIPRVSEFLGECILKIAKNLGKKRNFYDYPYKEEMIMDGVLVCIKYIDNFDPARSNNAFSYFTQICSFAYITRIKKEKKQTYVKFKSTINSAIMGDLAETQDESEHIMDNFEFQNDYMEQFIHNFEESLASKKEQAEEKKVGVENFIGDNDEND